MSDLDSYLDSRDKEKAVIEAEEERERQSAWQFLLQFCDKNLRASKRLCERNVAIEVRQQTIILKEPIAGLLENVLDISALNGGQLFVGGRRVGFYAPEGEEELKCQIMQCIADKFRL